MGDDLNQHWHEMARKEELWSPFEILRENNLVDPGDITEGDIILVRLKRDPRITLQDETTEKIIHFQSVNHSQIRDKVHSWKTGSTLYSENKGPVGLESETKRFAK
jgi:hypothetical protein